MFSFSVYPAYAEYREDVAPWLGKVPKDWRFEKAKWFLAHRKQLNADGAIDNVLSLTLRGVVNNDPENPEGLVPKDYRTYQIFDQNDLVFKLIDLENVRTSRVGLVHERGIMSSAYVRVVPPRDWNPRFLHYWYYHLYQAEVFNKIGSGVRSTLGQSDLLELPIPIIARDLQDRIVALLDEKCAKIDEAVRIKEEQIALLREQRQILIQQAVIRGLNPDAPMKDSGIDWIGQIPAHWDVENPKWLFSHRKERARKGEPQLAATQKYGVIPQSDFMDLEGRRITQVFLDFDILKHVEAGDFVMSMRSFQGGLEYSEYTGCVSSAYVALEPGPRIFAPFFKYLFKSARYIEALQATSNLVRDGQALRFDNFTMVILPVVPLEEQRAIAEHLDCELAKSDQGIAVKEEQIAALKEYKTSLINAAVTGKIKVA
jgi:type I restriction enzyme S subunit